MAASCLGPWNIRRLNRPNRHTPVIAGTDMGKTKIQACRVIFHDWSGEAADMTNLIRGEQGVAKGNRRSRLPAMSISPDSTHIVS